MDDAETDALRDQFVAEFEHFAVPGVSWAVIDGGEIAATGGVGLAESSGRTAVSPRTLFQACSISIPVAVFAML